ncbi:MAG: ArgP/LysG family DNA-binding transcriptional regulator [Propionibacteriaceae bacterium]|nr:ArgP/LysG family DNA-binding transcriptional regulator [Propionibacteriaceae bacterium]
MQIEQLRAFATAIDLGTLDAAARALALTPSAMSQRLRALETSAGAVLLERTTPVRPTASGEIVLRLARQVLLAEAETRQALAGGVPEAPAVLHVVVNADSLATWFPGVLAEATAWPDAVLDLTVADQAVAAEHLTTGRAMAAITSAETPASGCRATPLGVMRYVCLARADLGAELAGMPMVNFGPDDTLQNDFLARHGLSLPTRVTRVPSSQGFLTAVEAGLGWGMVPELQAGDSDADLRPLTNDPVTDVPLFLHRWKLSSGRLDRLCAAIEKWADVHLAKHPATTGGRSRVRLASLS